MVSVLSIWKKPTQPINSDNNLINHDVSQGGVWGGVIFHEGVLRGGIVRTPNN